MADLMQTISNFGFGKTIASVAVIALFIWAIVVGGKGNKGGGKGGSSSNSGNNTTPPPAT